MKKDLKAEGHSRNPLTRNWRHRVSLTVKMVVLTIVTGLVVWLVLDYAMTSKLRTIFHSQLTERLGRYAMEDRLSFDHYVKAFQVAVKLFITQKNFSEYVENRQWTDDNIPRIIHHNRSPVWFPRRSALRAFSQPRYALLLDASGRTREVYHSRKDTIPLSLIKPAPLLIRKSHHQSFMTSIDNVPYIFSAESYFDSGKKVKAILLLASPIDDEFLNASLSTTQRGRLVALLTPEEEPSIMTSSNLEELPAGTRLNSLMDRYLITGKEFFDYGASELQIKLISFVSLDEIDLLTASVIARARQERAVLAFILILTSALMMFWITRNIHQITRRITDFSQHTLGMKPQELPKGDQLQILKERFQSLTDEVVKAREIIKQQAEEQTRLIVNNAFDAIITTDENGEIMTWNPQAENIFGLKREEAVGQNITRTINLPQYEEADGNNFRHFLDTGEEVIFNRQIQVTAVHSKGYIFPVELTISPARSDDRYIFIAIIRDITERKNAEQKLKDLNYELAQKNRELEQIIRITSHDLRTPLVNIYGFSKELESSVDKLTSDLLSDRIPKDIKEKVFLTLEKDMLESLKYITKSTSRMNVLLNGLLQLSRLGQVELNIQKVDMNNLMSDVSGIFEFQLKDGEVKLDISELPPCEGDEDQLNQVFSNLIGNALKFLDTGQAGIIEVTGHQMEGQSVYCVKDNGIGIDPDNINRIFEMFQQIMPGKSPGEGLGLTIVQKAVERHHGTIWVESEPGKGSRFFVSLPS